MAKTKTAKKQSVPSGLEPGLYVVSTPIGNSQDWSERAALVLEAVDIIAAEDTRVVKGELKKLGLTPKQVLSYHEHNESQVSESLLGSLEKGRSVGLVSDAGAPNVSDPGFHLVQKCFKKGIPVRCIPGPSSLTAVLSVSPLGGGTVFFAGFLPPQDQARLDAMTQYKQRADQLVFFEAPHRLRAFLQTAQEVFGEQNEIFIGRELTKPYEELRWCTISEARAHFQTNEPRGEFVVALKGLRAKMLSEIETSQEISRLLDLGQSASLILDALQPKSELPRKRLYDLITRLKKALTPP
ncbi:MAG: 16S rRNA (cytidine(1402)-2'-O)-methyltransferase [Oligoflexia bacterium]|nr:16S rRNA (cytidine(1402)-2'-O)-methyltransferase [Oligoflexia bacterium]